MPGAPSADVALAVRATTEWIEAVTGRRFPPDRSFRAGLEDGVLLCELMESLRPGSIRKINRSPSPIAYLDNIQQFLLGCKDLGLRDDQLFDMMDLQDPSGTSHTDSVAQDKRPEVAEKLKSVCLTMFWLSQAVGESNLKARLSLTAFKTLISHEQMSSVVVASGQPRGMVGGDNLSFEDEQTADQLLADIQSAVDEMLQDFQTNTLSPESTPTPPPSQPLLPPSTSPPSYSTASIDKTPADHPRVEVQVNMSSGGRGFGFQVSGGLDTVQEAQVDMVLPGSAAEEGGLRSGDKIVSVNGQDVTSLKHTDLVAIIRKAGAEGHISMGLMRALKDGERPPQPAGEDWKEKQRHAAALKRMYPKSHHFLDSQLGPTLTPVLEEEVDLLPPLTGSQSSSSPLPPLPGESSVSPLPPLPGESSGSPLPPLPREPPVSPNANISPLPPLPGEPPVSPNANISPLPPLPGEPPVSPNANISPLPPLPGELSPFEVLPEVAALASVRGSVREMEQLQESMARDTHISPSPPTHDVEDGSMDLESIVQELAMGGRPVEGGEGEGPVNGQPWEPKAQWEDGMSEGQGEVMGEGRKGKIWSFLEEKTRVSNEERALAVGSKPVPQQQTPAPVPAAPVPAAPVPAPPVFKKPPPPKVLPKPARKKEVSEVRAEQPPSPDLQQQREEGDGGVESVNGPIPSPDPNIITIQSTSSSEPLNVRPVVGEELELHGDIKIQKVAQTRWTPQKKSPEQVQRTMSTPPTRGPPTRLYPSPAEGYRGGDIHVQQPRQYDGSARRYTSAPPPHRGPIRQQSAPQYLIRSPQRAPPPPQTRPQLPRQQQSGTRTQWRQLAEQTRVSGPPRAPVRGLPHSSYIPSSQHNGGPSYDSLSKVVREARQMSSHQPQARSQTWGARERKQFLGQPSRGGRPALTLPDNQRQDGLQQAFLVRPADPHLPCSLCHKPVGAQPLIAIPGLHLHFHPNCFACPVCHTYLAPHGGSTSTTVMVRSMRPHCSFCTSNVQGVQATEC